MFPVSIVIVWLLSVFWGSKAAGFTPKPPPFRWHPAYWVAESACLGQKSAAAYFGALLMLFGAAASALGVVGEIIALGLLAPLPLFLIDFCRRDTRLRGIDYVFFNPFKPVSEQPTTVTSGGRQTEIFQIIYLHIPDAAWDELRGTMDENEQSYLARKRVAPTLFRAEVDADFMLLFDSLCMNRFVIHSENEVAMKAFMDALTAADSVAAPATPDSFDEQDSTPVASDIPDEFGPEDGDGGGLIDMATITGTTRENVTKGGKRGGRKIALENPGDEVRSVGQDALDALELGGADDA